MMRKRGILLVVIAGIGLLMIGAGIAAWESFRARETGLPPIDHRDPEQVGLGEQVYDRHCAACHGAELEGQPDWRKRLPSGRLPAPPHDETGHTWHHPDRVLFGITRHGLTPEYAPPGYESDMPAFETILSDAEIAAVLAFIKSTWPEDILRTQLQIDRQDQAQQ